MKNHKLLSTILILSLATTTLFAQGTQEDSAVSNVKKIGISKLLPHPALDAVEQGIQDYLATTDLEVEYNLQNANGDISTASSIAQQLKSDNCDVVVGIATPSAQSLANVFTDIPVVFSAVTDPVSASLEGGNICGVSDSNPVAEQIKLLVELTGAKTIGNVYASGEANGVVLMEMAKAACEDLGVEFVSSAVSNTSEVKMAAQSIIDRVDAIYVATDNTVISAVASIDDVCGKAGKPYLSSDPTSTGDLDCLVSWGFNYYNLGLATGKVIESCLTGTAPSEIGSVYLTDPSDFELWFNLDVAEALNITISDELLDAASVIIKDGIKTSKE
ncbi:MAG: ABC transporter substrate-binding protein [Sphaerochaetaceae bacterium]|nr:ABC transporter substrate-binding protein [Sphaerochaetaceae bacterium]MDC7238000.1 ABC transporter substrate-binding protein [Sphaerochaetaceae bacterium]MDC7249548.1 ABC transporter substrate-binding protein [Sphaerochaetaceae bacterium]